MARLPKRAAVLVVLAIAIAAAWIAHARYEAARPFEWSGTVEARTIAVGSRVGGRVQDVLVREGDRVAAGQAIVVLEPGDLEAQQALARAQLAQAKAELEKLERGARPEEIDAARARARAAQAAFAQAVNGSRKEEIAAAEARVVAAQTAVDKAQIDRDRLRGLVSTQSASQAQLDDAEAALKSAIAQRDAQKKILEELENGARREEIAQAAARAGEAKAGEKLALAGARIEDIAAAHAAVDAAKARVDQIAIAISELTIKAPRAARVEALDLRPGDIVAPNATAATLLEDDQLYVRIYVPETQLGRARVGDTVYVRVDTFGARRFRGEVEHIAGVGEYSPRNLQTADERADQVFAMRIGIREGAGDLRAGMAAILEVAPGAR
jgi:multidrug resistance efflux pump